MAKINYDSQPCYLRLTENGEPRELNSAQGFVYQLISELEMQHHDNRRFI